MIPARAISISPPTAPAHYKHHLALPPLIAHGASPPATPAHTVHLHNLQQMEHTLR